MKSNFTVWCLFQRIENNHILRKTLEAQTPEGHRVGNLRHETYRQQFCMMFSSQIKAWCFLTIKTGQIIPTSHDRFPPKCSLGLGKSPVFLWNLGWWNYEIWPDKNNATVLEWHWNISLLVNTGRLLLTGVLGYCASNIHHLKHSYLLAKLGEQPIGPSERNKN